MTFCDDCQCLSHDKSRRKRSGAALVEFVLVAPVVFVLLLFFVDVSRMLMLTHTADAAVYEGARRAVVAGADVEDAVTATQDLLMAASVTSWTVIVSPDQIEEDTALVTVSVEIPVEENAWLTPLLFRGKSVFREITLVTERAPDVQLTGLPELKKKKKK